MTGSAPTLTRLRARRHAPIKVIKVRYGANSEQFGDLICPVDTHSPVPLIVLIHGGFWKARYRCGLMRELALDIADWGWAALSLEYRRMGFGGGGGGWPATFLDIAAAFDYLGSAHLQEVDLTRVIAVGHSAGGHLALWAAMRRCLPEGAHGSNPRLVPQAVVALAPVSDLSEALRLGLGNNAAIRFLGAASANAGQLRLTSPIALLPSSVPQLLVHGDDDEAVPIAMSRHYYESARRAGDSVRFIELRGVGHMELIDPRSTAWERVREFLVEIT